MTVLLRTEQRIRASRTVTSESWRCARCGTSRKVRTPEGCPWCLDCRSVIALDPGYLDPYGPAEAQRLLDTWINTRPHGGHGPRRRTLANAGTTQA